MFHFPAFVLLYPKGCPKLTSAQYEVIIERYLQMIHLLPGQAYLTASGLMRMMRVFLRWKIVVSVVGMAVFWKAKFAGVGRNMQMTIEIGRASCRERVWS